jgi:predicted RecA/RadA family phage recombinase
MQNKVQNGEVINYIPSGSAVSAGDVVKIGNLFGVAATDIAVGALGAVEVEGVFDLPKAAVAFSQGDIVYWDESAGAMTNTDDTGTNLRAGLAWKAAASGDATVRMKLNR